MCDNGRECAAARALGFGGDGPPGRAVMPGRVREARPSDLPRILEVHRAAFPTPVESDLVAALLEGGCAPVSLVALADAMVAGHVLLSLADVVDADRTARPVLALAPLAVAPASQGRGLGSELVTASLDTARSLGAPAVIVLGHPGYYPRFGFVEAMPLGIQPPFPEVPSEAWMVVETAPGGLEGLTGMVRYAAPFDSLDA